jgi:predicted nucleic acid-binding protein
MYQTILDTNVLVAAMRSKHGASHRLLTLLGDSRWRPNVRVAMVLEYEAVLKRNCRQFGLTEEDIDDAVDAYLFSGRVTSLVFPVEARRGRP